VSPWEPVDESPPPPGIALVELREFRGIRRADIARILGRGNVSTFYNRLTDFERGQEIDGIFPPKVPSWYPGMNQSQLQIFFKENRNISSAQPYPTPYAYTFSILLCTHGRRVSIHSGLWG
jgi:hypothetical protein